MKNEITPETATLLTSLVRSALTSRAQAADVSLFLPFVRLSREVVSPDGQVGTIKTTFRFDGDMVLLRGFGKAAADLAALASSARHEGLTVR